MIQDKLIEGRAYWIRYYTTWQLCPATWEEESWWMGVDGLENEHVNEWLLIPTAEEIREAREKEKARQEERRQEATWLIEEPDC